MHITSAIAEIKATSQLAEQRWKERQFLLQKDKFDHATLLAFIRKVISWK
jgi:hypothetical protein